jgi:hypothetical protein
MYRDDVQCDKLIASFHMPLWSQYIAGKLLTAVHLEVCRNVYCVTPVSNGDRRTRPPSQACRGDFLLVYLILLADLKETAKKNIQQRLFARLLNF